MKSLLTIVAICASALLAQAEGTATAPAAAHTATAPAATTGECMLKDKKVASKGKEDCEKNHKGAKWVEATTH